MVQTETVAGHTKAWTLDPTGRLRSQTDKATGTTDTNHYADAGDSPAWIGTQAGDGATSWTRNVEGLAGDLAATINNTGAVVLQLTNIHGDVVATADDTTGASAVTAYFEATEFGIPRSGAASQRYEWLGGKRRSSDSLGSVVLMGVRLYDPAIGRFLQTDPVPGGSANDYDYASQDPINAFDLDGRCVRHLGWACWLNHQVANASRGVYRHASISFGGCFGGCFQLTLAHGNVYHSEGSAGLGLHGFDLGWSDTPASRVSTFTAQACGGYVVSACSWVGGKQKPDGHSYPSNSRHFSSGWSVGLGAGVQVGFMHTKKWFRLF